MNTPLDYAVRPALSHGGSRMRQFLICLLAVVLVNDSARAAAKDDVLAAALKLTESTGYSWVTTTVARGRTVVEEGRITKDGLTHLVVTTDERIVDIYVQNGRGITNRVDGWQTLEYAAHGPAGAFASIARARVGAGGDAHHLAARAPDFVKDGDAYFAPMSPEWVTERMGGRKDVPLKGAKGHLKFWIKNGLLTRAEYHREARLPLDGRERLVTITDTVEFKRVGRTAIEIPPAAAAKWQEATK